MKYVMHDGELRPWAEVAARRRNRARSSLPAPMIISDHLDGVKNPVDGKTYDSKSGYYRAVKDAGCEIVGNEKHAATAARSPVTRDHVREAVQKVKQGYKPEIKQGAKWLSDGSGGIWGHFDE